MADSTGRVEMRFDAVDGISGPMKKAAAQLEQTAAAMQTVQAAQGEVVTQTVQVEESLDKTTDAADRAMAAQDRATLKSVETLAAMHALQSGLSAITSSVQTLGLVDEETYKTLQKVTAGIQLVVGTAEAVKGLVTLFGSLNSVLKTTAIVGTFASVAENPLAGAAIVGAAGFAAGALGGYMLSSINNNKSTTINVQHDATARQVETLADAGAWY